MKQIKDHIQYILENGILKPGRNGKTDSGDASYSVFSRQLRFNLSEGLPFVTSKKLHVIPMLKEITWMLRGETNVNTLGCGIWDKWSASQDLGVRTPRPEKDVVSDLMDKMPEFKTYEDVSLYLFGLMKAHFKQDPEKPLIDLDAISDATLVTPEFNAMVDWDALDKTINDLGVETTELKVYVKKGECGPIYGSQWRNFQSVTLSQGVKGLQSIDQLMMCYDLLANSPDSRRIIFDAWNPGLVPKSEHSINTNIAMGNMGLPPCHIMAQFWVGAVVKGRRSLHLNLRMRSSDTGLGLPFNVGSYALIDHIYALEFDMDVGELVVDLIDAHIYKDHVIGLREYLDRPEHPLPKFVLTKEQYEQRKTDLINAYIERQVPNDEDHEFAIQRHREHLFADTDSARRTRFEILLNNIDHTFFEDTIQNYVHEDEIKLNLHD